MAIMGVRSNIPLGRTLDGLVRLWNTPVERLGGTMNYDAAVAARDLNFSLPSLTAAASPSDIGIWKQRVMRVACPIVSSRLEALAKEPNIVEAVRTAEVDLLSIPAWCRRESLPSRPSIPYWPIYMMR